MEIASCTPFALHFCPQSCWSRQISWIICVLLYYGQKLLLVVVMSIGRLMSVYYQQASNFCRPVFTYWLTDWRHRWLTDCWSYTAFCCDSFSLLWQLCTVGHGILLYGRCQQLFVSELNNTFHQTFILKQCLSGYKSCITVYFTYMYSLRIAIFSTQIFHKLV